MAIKTMKTKHTISQCRKLEEINFRRMSANIINQRIIANRTAVVLMKRALEIASDTNKRNYILHQINDLENELSGCELIDLHQFEIERIKLIQNN